MARIGLERGLPAAISVDNGTEFTARAMDHWAYTHRVELDYSRPGKPTDNAFIEAFNSLVRRECLSQHYFSTLEEAWHVLETWREDYNNHRPHGSLGDRTPAEYKTGGYNVPDRNRLLNLRLMDQSRVRSNGCRTSLGSGTTTGGRSRARTPNLAITT